MSASAHQERLMQVLLGPHVSEKSTSVAASANQVVFKVRSDATKADVRRAVELLFAASAQDGKKPTCVWRPASRSTSSAPSRRVSG